MEPAVFIVRLIGPVNPEASRFAYRGLQKLFLAYLSEGRKYPPDRVELAEFEMKTVSATGDKFSYQVTGESRSPIAILIAGQVSVSRLETGWNHMTGRVKIGWRELAVCCNEVANDQIEVEYR